MAQRKGTTYEIRYTRIADRFFRTHEDVREAYKAAIRALLTGDHPESVDVKKVREKRNDYYRIRLGDWRVVYAIIDGKVIVITTLLAGARGDIYKKMDGLK